MIDGDVFPLQTDYRAGVACFTALMHREPTTVQRFLELWYPVRIPADTEAALEAAEMFFRCGEAPMREEVPTPPAYAYDVDAEALIAAFQREYGIDLTTAQLHWWRFRTLVHGLLTHSFAERVRYRVCDAEDIKSAEMRSECRKYKARYALDMDGRPVEQPKTLDAYNEMLLRIARGEMR